LPEHRHESFEALFQRRLARRIVLGIHLPVQLLGRRHPLMRQCLDRVGLALLLVVALPR
jgi:hypothetical protein